jgi:hypothetical protein
VLRTTLVDNLRGLRKLVADENSNLTTKRTKDTKFGKNFLIFFSYLRDFRAFVVNISSSYTLRLGVFAGDTPDSLVASDTSGRAKKAHAFARVENVALCPSQDFGFAVIHGTSQANPIQKLVLTRVSNQLCV